MWTIWKTWFLDVLNGYAPRSDITIEGNNLPYITMEVRQMIRQRDYLRKKANKTGSNILRQAFQQIRNKVTYTIRKLRAEHYSKTLKKNEGDLKETWKILKQTMCTDTKTIKIDHINIYDTTINDKQKISEALNDHLFQFEKSSQTKFNRQKIHQSIIYLKQSVMVQILNFETFDRIK